ncbi:MAG: ECF-type sigma factor [Pirellulaceae bacterium]
MKNPSCPEIQQVSPSGDGEITRWLDDLQNNDEAAEALWRHFFPKLVDVAEQRMQHLPSRARDEEDVALSAMQSFFAAAEAGRFDFKSRDDLWRLLVTITIRKVTKERRRQLARKRGGGVPHIGNHWGEESIDPMNAIVDPSQMPEFVEDVHARCNELLDSLPDEKMRITAAMKLEGCSNEEISELLHCKTEDTKSRLRKIRRRWQRHLGDD